MAPVEKKASVYQTTYIRPYNKKYNFGKKLKQLHLYEKPNVRTKGSKWCTSRRFVDDGDDYGFIENYGIKMKFVNK